MKILSIISLFTLLCFTMYKIKAQSHPSRSKSNLYDTYYATECRRVRKPWNALTSDERHLYIDGLLALRAKGALDIHLDEFVAIGSVHDDHFGSVTHHDSDYLFWHGYLVWELESRIRNLGGKYKCFGMPYWDFTTESDRQQFEDALIFQTGLGGTGDPDDQWKVNGYSWDVTTAEYWTPFKMDNCTASGDEYPICSLKRNSNYNKIFEPSADVIGSTIIEKPFFYDFQPWICASLTLARDVDNSYDPIWYLFHSMESYFQAIWVNCHDYDLIDSQDLDEFPAAFSEYCDVNNSDVDSVNDCVGIKLADPLYFGGYLAEKEWSFIHNHVLTVQKLYDLPQWNIIYDLSKDSFFSRSGLAAHCRQKLNPEWFILDSSENLRKVGVQRNSIFNLIFSSFLLDPAMVITCVVFICFGLVTLVTFCAVEMEKVKINPAKFTDYGSISFADDVHCPIHNGQRSQ